MTATVKVARDEIMSLINVAWLADATTVAIPLLFQNVKGDPPTDKDGDGNAKPWARVTIQHVEGGQATLGDEVGRALFTRIGLVTVQIFAPAGLGFHDNSLLDDMTEVALGTFEGVSTASNVWFRDAQVNEVGLDGPWFQTNVVVSFTYDQLR